MYNFNSYFSNSVFNSMRLLFQEKGGEKVPVASETKPKGKDEKQKESVKTKYDKVTGLDDDTADAVEKGASDSEYNAQIEAIQMAFDRSDYLSKNFDPAYEGTSLAIYPKTGDGTEILHVYIEKGSTGKGVLNNIVRDEDGGLYAETSSKRSPKEIVTAIENLMKSEKVADAQYNEKIGAIQKALDRSDYLNKNFDPAYEGTSLAIYPKTGDGAEILHVSIEKGYSVSSGVLKIEKGDGMSDYFGKTDVSKSPAAIVKAIEDFMRKHSQMPTSSPYEDGK